MPEDATIEDVEQIHMDAWKMGLKAVAIYRDNCKVGQPLSMAKKAPASVGVGDGGSNFATASAGKETSATEVLNDRIIVKGAMRRELPKIRNAKTFSFKVAGSKGFVTVGEFEDGTPGEVFMKIAKQGSTLAGVMDSLAISISYGLQYGVPLKSYVYGLTNMTFAPAGVTDDAEIRTATSLVDYVFKRLALTYLNFDDRLELGLASIDDMPDDQTSLLPTPETGAIEEKIDPTKASGASHVDAEAVFSASITASRTSGTASEKRSEKTGAAPQPAGGVSGSAREQASGVRGSRQDDTAPMCYNCGNQTQRAGSCYVCTACGSTTGCS
jgi:ribonucleoside-diphosphate reductase alpha chain